MTLGLWDLEDSGETLCGSLSLRSEDAVKEGKEGIAWELNCPHVEVGVEEETHRSGGRLLDCHNDRLPLSNFWQIDREFLGGDFS